jgi:hypothetical protein
VRRNSVTIAATLASAEPLPGDDVLVRLESDDGVVTATLPITVAQRFLGQLQAALEPRRVQRGWGSRLSSEFPTAPRRGAVDEIFEGDRGEETPRNGWLAR